MSTDEMATVVEPVNDGRGTVFYTPYGSDPEIRRRIGLGGAALCGDLMFVGGMPLDLTTMRRYPDATTITEETRASFRDISGTLAKAGLTLTDTARITCYVQELEYAEEMMAAVGEIFAPAPFPKIIVVKAGIAADCRVEFEVLAVRPGSNSKAEATTGTKSLLGVSSTGASSGVALSHFVYASATALDEVTMKRAAEAESFEDEVKLCMDRISATLAEEGLSLRSAAKTLAWITEEQYRGPFVRAYTPIMAPAPFPSRAMVATGRPDALLGGCRVLVEIIALR